MIEPDVVAQAAAPHWTGRRRRFAGALAIAIPILALFAPVLFFGRALYIRDTGLAFYPHKALVHDALVAGRLPQWTPAEYGGMPVAADPNFSVFHPLSFLTSLLPMPWGYQVFVVACVLVGAFGVRALARELEAGEEGALVAAACWAWSGPFLSVAMTGQVAAPAFLPWLCAAGARLARDGSGRAVALAAVATAALALAGTPEIAGCGVVVALALAARGGGRSLSRALGAVALGAGMAAIQIVPTALFLRESSRGAGFDPAESFAGALVPARLPNLLVPFFAGAQDAAGTTSWMPASAQRLTWIEDLHLGVVPLLLALASFRARGARLRAVLWICAAAFLVLALGAATPVYRTLWALLPPLRRVRFPEKFVVPLALAVAVAAGAGWERVRERVGRVRAPLVAAVALAAGAGALWILAPRIAPRGLSQRELECLRDTALRTGPIALALAGAALGLAALVQAGRVTARTALVAGVALLALDLVPPALRLLWTLPADRLEAPSAAADLMRRDAAGETRLFRVDVEPTGLSPEQVDALGDPSWDRPARIYWLRHLALFHPGRQQGDLLLMRGYASFTSGRTKELLRDGGKPGVDALAIRYGIEFGGPRASLYGRLGFQPIASLADGYLRIWRNPNARARLRLAAAAIEGGSIAPACAAVRLAEADLAMLPDVLRTASCDGVGEPAGTARLVRDEPEHVEAAVDTPAPAVLVLADSASAGWSVEVDGARAPLLEANGALLAVAVPAGRHGVVFSYRTPGLAAGASVSLAGVAVALFLALRRR